MDFLMKNKKRGHGQCLISNKNTRYMNQVQCFFFLQIVLIFFIIIHSTLLNDFYRGNCFLGKKSASNSHKTVIGVALVLWLVLNASGYTIRSHIVILRNLMAKVSEK